MRKLLVLLLIISCGCFGQKKTDLHIPDTVNITKGEPKKQFYSTRVFICPPEGYLPFDELWRFQKNEHTYIQALDIPGADYYEFLPKFKEKMLASLKNDKVSKPKYTKEFKFGDYDAILYYGYSKDEGVDEITMIFGNHEVTAMAMAKVPEMDTISRREIINAMMTLEIDQNANVNTSALETFTIDLTGTEFKYNTYAGYSFTYTIDGLGNPVNNDSLDQITIISMPSVGSDKELKKRGQDIANGAQVSEIDRSSYKEQAITIDGKYAYEITIEGTLKGRPITIYLVSTGNENASVLFGGTAYIRRDELLKQFKKVATTLKLK